jgi:hypothetical protein
MPSSDHRGKQSAERARALLAVLDIQPPPDFEVQVLARVYALQARRTAPPALSSRPRPSQRPSRGWRRVCWYVRLLSWLSGPKMVACGLVVASAVLLWCVSTRLLPAALPEGERQASTTLQYDTASIEDHLDSSRCSAAALQEVVATAKPVPEPSTGALQSREAQMDERDLLPDGEHPVPPETPMAPGLPLWNREAPKFSARAPEQRSGRQRGIRGKAKRLGKGLWLSRHVPV